MITTEKLDEVIRLADAVRETKPPSEELISLEDISADETAEYRALKEYVRQLTADEKCDLMAVMWIGRGDTFSEAEHYEDALRHAGKVLDAGTVAYVTGKTPLAEYLREGMFVLNRTTLTPGLPPNVWEELQAAGWPGTNPPSLDELESSTRYTYSGARSQFGYEVCCEGREGSYV